MPKRPFNEICDGLPTKSAKIRALGREGYSRTDIANYLGIRYQHARKVLVDAGITTGTRNDLPNKRKKAKAPDAAAPWPATKLLAAGFEPAGKCQLVAGEEFEYTSKAPTETGVYAFAVNGFITYIGLTRGSLRTRLGHYVKGHSGQKTSARIKGLILKELAKGIVVEVHIARPPSLEWNGLPVDGPSGLETGLIRLVRPPWNQQGVN